MFTSSKKYFGIKSKTWWVLLLAGVIAYAAVPQFKQWVMNLCAKFKGVPTGLQP